MTAVCHLIILAKRKSLQTHIGIVLRQEITKLERGERFLMLKKRFLTPTKKPSRSYQLLTILRHNQTNKPLDNDTSFWCNIRHLCVHRKPGGRHRLHHHVVPVHISQLRRQEPGQSSGFQPAVKWSRHSGPTRFCRYHLRWIFRGPTWVEVVCHVLDTNGKL